MLQPMPFLLILKIWHLLSKSDTKISEDISLGLIRDEAYTSRDLAPIGTETTIEKVPFRNLTTAKFTFKFNNLNLIGRVGRYNNFLSN